MERLRVGMIGAGGHAQSHFAMIAAEPEVELVAVAEIDPDRLAKGPGRHTARSTDSRIIGRCSTPVSWTWSTS